MLLSVVYLYASIYVSQYSNIHSGNLNEYIFSLALHQ